MRIAILISGSGSNMVSLVNSMQSGEVPAEPVRVISNRADAAGLEKAEALGVTTETVPSKGRSREDFEADLTAALKVAEIDAICFAGFMRILTEDFIKEWSGKMVNIHPSLLPSFKGLDTHARALAAGVAVHGCSVHEVTPDLDGGPILAQAVVPVQRHDTPDTLAARVLVEEHRLYKAALARWIKGDKGPYLLPPQQ